VERVLIHVPIIHTQADMGALGDRIRQQLVHRFGEQWWRSKASLVDRIWDEIEATLLNVHLPYDHVRIYQDGLPICGRELDIVNELAAAGSRNHRLLLEMARRGALIMGTESGELLVEEYSRVQRLLGTSGVPTQQMEAKASGGALIEKRDRFVANRIDSTLARGELGIVFMGSLHSIARFLPKDIRVVALVPFADNRRRVLQALRQATQVG
jgi:hypothetical protein